MTPAMPEQMAQSRSMSPLCHAQSTKRVFTASATCRSGRRSKQAAEKLLELGYQNVYDFGGVIDWPYELVKEG